MKESTINVWHGMGHISACVSHDGDIGNAACTYIDLNLEECPVNLLVEGQWIDDVRKLSVHFYGSAERWGMAELLKAAGKEVSKPADQLGQQVAVDLDSFMYEADYPSISKKGQIGETALNDWFKSIGISSQKRHLLDAKLAITT